MVMKLIKVLHHCKISKRSYNNIRVGSNLNHYLIYPFYTANKQVKHTVNI